MLTEAQNIRNSGLRENRERLRMGDGAVLVCYLFANKGPRSDLEHWCLF